ncbi:hypothetical protein ACQWKR_24195, partial [Salmonella enterica subsp. enterica serovar Infantis]
FFFFVFFVLLFDDLSVAPLCHFIFFSLLFTFVLLVVFVLVFWGFSIVNFYYFVMICCFTSVDE